MSRAPFQVLVFLYWISPAKEIKYAILKRETRTGGYWQGVAGGGEGTETPLEAAKREAFEETGTISDEIIALDTVTMIPVAAISGFIWGEDTFVIPEYCFGMRVAEPTLTMSHEHTEVQWLESTEAQWVVRWDSNRTALWELDCRLRRRLDREPSATAPHASLDA